MNENATNSKEERIAEMLSAIQRVDTAETIVTENSVAEYQQGAIREGSVVGVPQAHAGQTETKPIRTDALDKCVALIYCLPDQATGGNTYYLVHIQDGDLAANAAGAQKADLKNTIDSHTPQAILLHSERSYSNGTALARELGYLGFETTKIINAPSGNSLIDVVYRPSDNKILVRIKSTGEVHIFSGF